MARMPGPYFGIRFSAISVFCANWAEIFYGSSGDHYLSIGDDKSKLQCLIIIFYVFLGTFRGKMGVATMVWGLKPQLVGLYLDLLS